jgi:hypothetical protein
MKTKQQKALAEKRAELLLWRQWRRERVDALLVGPYGEPARALLAFLKTMTKPTALIEFVKAGPWSDTDADVRFEILSLLDAVIVKRREHMELDPFDDVLPGEPENVFLILRAWLADPFPPDGGASRGVARFNQPKIPKHETLTHERLNYC